MQIAILRLPFSESVCLSVRPLHADIVFKRLGRSSNSQRYTTHAFMHHSFFGEIAMGSPPTEVPDTAGVGDIGDARSVYSSTNVTLWRRKYAL